MAPRNRPDGLHGSAAALNPERSDDEVFLDRFADNPLGGTKLYHFFWTFPVIHCFPSEQEIERFAQHQVNAIFTAFESVRYILERHEDTIRERWCKKSTAKKRKLLLAGRPGMESEHRPDLAAMAAIAAQCTTPVGQEPDETLVRVAIARNSEACTLPYLNIEDLVRPGTFLTLLSSRGHNPVSSFSHTEFLHSPLARWPDVLLEPYLSSSTMQFLGQHTRSTYGRMKQWKNENDASESIYKGRGVHPGHGLKILRIQEILYTFLQRCCVLLARDILSDETTRMGGYPVIQPPQALIDSTTNHTSRAEVSLMAPYTVPSRLDLGRLRVLVDAKVGELEDHIWALREDPGYFREVFDDNKAHRMEYLKSTDGNVNAILKEPPHAMVASLVRNLIIDAYLPLCYWHECLRLVKHLQSTAARTDFRLSPNQDLPPEDHMNFLRLWTMLLALHTDFHENFGFSQILLVSRTPQVAGTTYPCP